MTAFVVIGVHEQVKVIVDGISKCRPHNPLANIVISSGTIVEKKINSEFLDAEGNENIDEQSSMWYEYDVFNGDSSTKANVAENVVELSNLIYIQLSQLRSVSSNNSVVNVFVIANLLSQKDVDRIRFTLEEVKKIPDGNIQLFLIVTAFDLTKVDNVSIRPCKSLVKSFLTEIQDDVDHIMYLSNNDLNHSAVDFKENHLSEMLSDYFMLLSNENNSYFAHAAINTKCFSIGYSSFKFDYSDFKNYIEITTKRDFLNFILNEPCDDIDESLIYNAEKYPFSLISRKKILENRIKNIEFYEDINSLNDDNIFKKRNQIILELRRYILHEDYIDRDEIFRLSKGCEPSKLTQKENTTFKEAKTKYEKLIEHIKSDEFFESTKEKTIVELTLKPSKITQQKTWLESFLSFLGIRKNSNTQEIDEPTPVENLSEEQKVRKLWNEFKDTFETKEKVDVFSDFVDKKVVELESIEKSILAFKFTEILKIKPLIDLDKLKSFQEEHSKLLLKRIIDNFKHELSHKTIYVFFAEQLDEFMIDYKFIDWNAFSDNQTSEKFSFIKDLSTVFLTQSINYIQDKSIPFITYNDFAPINTNGDVVKLFYIGNQSIVNLINQRSQKLSNINDLNAILSYTSTHIESKMCMFQIQPIKNIEFLSDCQ